MIDFALLGILISMYYSRISKLEYMLLYLKLLSL